MSDEFEYLPLVHTPYRWTEDQVRAAWTDFSEYRRYLNSVREDFTGRPFRTGAHERCTESDRKPDLMIRVFHFNAKGRQTHMTTHPNLLSPEFWRHGRHENETSLVRPGHFRNEIRDAVA